MASVDLDHPSWRTAAGTFLSYLLVLVAMTAVLFGLPYLAFVLFA